MPTSLWIFICFMSGLFVLPTIPPDVKSPVRRIALSYIGVAVAFILTAIAFNEDLGNQNAYEIETFLVHDRVSQSIVFFLLGVLTAYYKQRINKSIDIGINNFKNNNGDIFGWPTQIAAAIFMFIFIIVVLHPELLEKITSIKAWQVEASFAPANNASIKDTPIVDFKDERRKSNVGQWADFSMKNLRPKFDLGTAGDDGGRKELFLKGGGNETIFSWSDALFEKQLKPLFSAIRCFDEAGLTMVAQNDDELASLVAQYANAVRNARLKPTIIDKANSEMVGLQKSSIDVLTHLNEKFHKIMLRDELTCKIETIDMASLAKEFSKLDCRDNACPKNLTAADLWDPYAIAAVADLIAFVDDQRKGAEFLTEVATDILEPPHQCGPDNCGRRTPGFFNLSYAIVLSQLNGGGPWPLDAALKHLDAAMEGIDDILWRKPHDTESCANKIDDWCLQRRFLLRSEFIDLSLGLSLFDHHALSGEKLKPQDLARWRAWLTQTQLILKELKSTPAPSGSSMEKDRAVAWRDAADHIAQQILSVGDIEASAALDPLLLAQQNGRPSAEDCLISRAAFTHLRRIDFNDIAKAIGPDLKDLYTGYLGQIESRISGLCEN